MVGFFFFFSSVVFKGETKHPEVVDYIQVSLFSLVGGLNPVWSGSLLRVQRNRSSNNNHWIWSNKSWGILAFVGALYFQDQVQMSPPGEVFLTALAD